MDIMIAGASKSRERKDACECCSEGDAVVLERQPGNRYDRNAILIRNAARRGELFRSATRRWCESDLLSQEGAGMVERCHRSRHRGDVLQR
jgi:hypothetical protein